MKVIIGNGSELKGYVELYNKIDNYNVALVKTEYAEKVAGIINNQDILLNALKFTLINAGLDKNGTVWPVIENAITHAEGK